MKLCLLWIAVPLLFAQNGAVVEGTAFNKVTHAGVPGVIVKLAPSSAPDKRIHVVTSDAAGFFRIDDVKEGEYSASFEVPHGFLEPSRWTLRVPAAGGPPKISVSVLPLGSLRGRVVDAERHPMPGIRVELFRVHNLGGHIMTTDDEGRFFADQLIPGAYQLRARPVLPGTPLGERTKSVSPLPATPPEGERWVWAPTYFPNAIEISAASTIVVRDGSELTGYEIRLRAAPVYRVRGVVRDDQGKPARGVSLWLLSETGWSTGEARMQSGQDGAFEFPSVRSGRWQVTAEAKRGDTKWMGFLEMTVPQHDLDNVSVRITPPSALEGSVTGTPPNPTVQTRVTVLLLPVVHGEESVATEQPNGALHFENVYPGAYRVNVWARVPDHYLHSILLGTQDVTGQVVDLAADSPPIRVIFKSNAARARGFVENGAGIKVVLIDADRGHSVPGQSLHATACDREGRFTLDGLRPATYYAFAFDIVNVESGAIEEAVFVKGLDRQAPTLRLAEGETATLDLKITPWPD